MGQRTVARSSLELSCNEGMTFADLALAQRIEKAQADYAAAGALAWQEQNPSKQVAVLEVAGGRAVFLGSDSPLTHAIGLGLNGEVKPADLDRLEDFYRGRDLSVKIDLCPLADPSLVNLLARRGYHPVEFANVLFRSLDGDILCATQNGRPSVRQIAIDEREIWSRILARGFFELQELTHPLIEIGLIICNAPSTRCLVGPADGEPAGAGGLACWGDMALMFADSTLPEFRNRGLHTALIQARVAIARQEGCRIATADTLPGSGSQRHYERCGFQVVYTKTIMEREL